MSFSYLDLYANFLNHLATSLFIAEIHLIDIYFPTSQADGIISPSASYMEEEVFPGTAILCVLRIK